MAKRKYTRCQKCGKAFTHNEHHFAKYCVECNPPKEKIAYGVKVLPKEDYNFKFVEYSLAVRCRSCNLEIDMLSYKTQAHEAVCPGCGRRYEVELVVKEVIGDGYHGELNP